MKQQFWKTEIRGVGDWRDTAESTETSGPKNKNTKEKPATWTLENPRTTRRVTDPPQSGELGNHASPALWDMGGLFSRKIEHKQLEGSLGC